MSANFDITEFSGVETELVHRRLQSEVMVALQGELSDVKEAGLFYWEKYPNRLVRMSTEKLVCGDVRMKITFLDYEP